MTTTLVLSPSIRSRGSGWVPHCPLGGREKWRESNGVSSLGFLLLEKWGRVHQKSVMCVCVCVCVLGAGVVAPLKIPHLGASLVAPWWRICLPMQETQVWSLIWEDSTCCRATKPVPHNYWACALESRSRNCWCPRALKPVLITREATTMRSLRIATRD